MPARTEMLIFPMPEVDHIIQCATSIHIAQQATNAFEHQYRNASQVKVYVRGHVIHNSNGIKGYLSDWHQVIKLDEEYGMGLGTNETEDVIWVQPVSCEMKLECIIPEG